LNQTSPVYLIIDRKFYLFAKISLNQIRGFAKVFKSKFKANQKIKEKEIRKRLKGPGGRIRPATEGSPRPTFPPSPNRYPSFLSLSLMLGPTCHPSQANRLEHGAPEHDLAGFLANLV
jgi:hypothetical protein